MAMFLDYFQLKEQPFGVTPDPAYLYPSRTHRHALTALSWGIREGRGFMGLIAEPGLGKTTVLNHLMDQVRDAAQTVFLFQTHCNAHEFFEYVLSELGVDTKGLGLVAMHNKLNEALFAEMFAGQRFLLVVDEAQNLSEGVLETLRMLSNYETQHTKLLQIVLAGQPQLAVKLARPGLTQLRQRMAVLSHLDPLTPEETEGYVEHRLEAAGYSGEPLFTPEAMAFVARASRGVPRVINNICCNALAAAEEQRQRTIGTNIVQEAAGRLELHSMLVPPAVALVPTATGNATVERVSPAARPVLTYPKARIPQAGAPAVALRRPRGLRAAALTVSLLAAGALWFPSLVGPGARGQATAREIFSAAWWHADGTAKAAAPVAPKAYMAEPQETGSGPVLTVVAKPEQSLKEISLEYLGRFDYGVFEDICALNPELKDPYHLEAGALIRLPLPKDALRKAHGTASDAAR